MENAVKLCGLWKQKAKKDGKPFLSGKMSPSAKLVVFPNGEKKTEKSPDYVAYFVRPQEKEEEEAPF